VTPVLRTARRMLVLSWRMDRRVTVLAGALTLVGAGSLAGTGLSQRWLIDGARGHDTARVVMAAVLGMVAFVLQVGIGRIQSNLRVDICERLEIQLSQEVLASAAQIPTIDHLDSADYLDRLSLLRRGTGALAGSFWAMATSAAALMSLAASVWLLATVHPALILLAACCVPVLVLGHRGAALRQAVNDETAEPARLEKELQLLFLQPQTAKELYVCRSGPALDERGAELAEQVARASAGAAVRAVLLAAAGWAVYGIGLAAALLITANEIISHRVGIGTVVLLTTIAAQLRGQVGLALNAISQVAEAGRVAEHYQWLQEFAEQAPRGQLAAPRSLREGVTLTDVSFRYPGTDTDVLRGLSLRLPAGSVVGLVGINGAGKSTLVKLLTGLYQPSTGTVSVDGVNLTDIDQQQWAQRCTGTMQDFLKPQLLVREAVGVGSLPAMGNADTVAAAVEQAGAGPLTDALSEGLDTQLGHLFGGTELSHGQWQRLAVARAMMRANPLLAILDEPSAALDPQAEHDLFQRISEHARTVSAGGITLLISHRFSTVQAADLILVLADGRLTEQGSHAELMALGGTYAGLYQAQARAHQVH
jgi:ATP-binding cassette, subfamily B, bacterial